MEDTNWDCEDLGKVEAGEIVARRIRVEVIYREDNDRILWVGKKRGLIIWVSVDGFDERGGMGTEPYTPDSRFMLRVRQEKSDTMRQRHCLVVEDKYVYSPVHGGWNENCTSGDETKRFPVLFARA